MRIQILTLPPAMVGDDMEEPFALVFDQIDEDVNKELLHEFARQCGAKTHIMLPQTAEVVDQRVIVGQMAEATPEKPETAPEGEQRKPDTAIYGVLFGARVRLEWPDGPPPGLDRRKVTAKLNEVQNSASDEEQGDQEDQR